ncbi:MAG: tetratricopeptide repeat protein, partial [Candidatus Eremiobacteraeota bacterium]|nr:tetratricopeptide repeat protein [Candidatus Eremiobacteraeota bacterium]
MSFDRALAAYQASRFEECLALLEGSNDGRAQSICAACYLHLGHWPQAAALYGQLHRQDPSDLEAAYGLGLACLALEDLPTAEQVFQRVVRLDPSHQRAWFQLGTVYCSASKWRSAIDCLTRSLEFFPDDVEALTNLGVAYLQSGDSERARRAWQKALDFNPGAQGAAQNLARLDSQATASFGAVTVDTQLDVDRAAIASQVRQGLIETGRFEHRPEGVPVVVRLEVGGSLFETVYVITIMVGETTESVEATSLEHIASVCRLGCAQFGPDAIRAPGEDPQACLLLGQQLISSLQQDSSCTPALKEQALATAEKLEQFASQQPDLRLTAAGLYDLLD